MYSINDINDSSILILKKVPIKIISWITIVIIFIIFFVIFSLFYNYRYYLKYPAIFIDDNKIKLSMNLEDIVKLSDYELLIDNKVYSYQIEEVKEINNFYEVVLKLNLNLSKKYFNIYFRSDETTIFKEFIKKIERTDLIAVN